MDVRLTELDAAARDIIARFPAQRGERAYVLGFSGELGAGKTTLIQHIARALGVTDAVTSPTYVLAERYPLAGQPFTSLIHIDAYRITADEAHTIGWDAYTSDPSNLILVEWPERLGPHAAGIPMVTLAVVDAETRSITYA